MKLLKLKSSFILVVSFLGLTFMLVQGCGIFPKKEKKLPELVGSDKDKHGCIPSAGYTWSVIKDSCIRVFELSDVMYHPDDSLRERPCYFMLSEDLMMVELFPPSPTSHLVMLKNGEDWKDAEQTHIFTRFTDGTCELRHQAGNLLFEGGMP